MTDEDRKWIREQLANVITMATDQALVLCKQISYLSDRLDNLEEDSRRLFGDPTVPAPEGIVVAPKPPTYRRILCSKGCCFECESCSAKPGSPTLCKSCLELRDLCNSLPRTAAEGFQPITLNARDLVLKTKARFLPESGGGGDLPVDYADLPIEVPAK